jgi:hypothetical protein
MHPTVAQNGMSDQNVDANNQRDSASTPNDQEHRPMSW